VENLADISELQISDDGRYLGPHIQLNTTLFRFQVVKYLKDPQIQCIDSIYNADVDSHKYFPSFQHQPERKRATKLIFKFISQERPKYTIYPWMIYINVYFLPTDYLLARDIDERSRIRTQLT